MFSIFPPKDLEKIRALKYACAIFFLKKNLSVINLILAFTIS